MLEKCRGKEELIVPEAIRKGLREVTFELEEQMGHFSRQEKKIIPDNFEGAIWTQA